MFADDATPESVLKILREERLKEKAYCKDAIFNYEIAWNRKWKNIACRLSEYLAYSREEQKAPNRDAYGHLFHTAMDIEHIQSYHDKDGTQRKKMWKEWGQLINGIGNLTMLESNINRSIGNEPFEEKINPERNLSYRKSEYRNVQALTELSTWTKELCETRRDAETEKLVAFLLTDDDVNLYV
jgi:hypothetical protein